MLYEKVESNRPKDASALQRTPADAPSPNGQKCICPLPKKKSNETCCHRISENRERNLTRVEEGWAARSLERDARAPGGCIASPRRDEPGTDLRGGAAAGAAEAGGCRGRAAVRAGVLPERLPVPAVPHRAGGDRGRPDAGDVRAGVAESEHAG